jgi:hypothetical protein
MAAKANRAATSLLDFAILLRSFRRRDSRIEASATRCAQLAPSSSPGAAQAIFGADSEAKAGKNVWAPSTAVSSSGALVTFLQSG